MEWNKIIDSVSAEKLWKKKSGTIRKAIGYGKFKTGIDCQKFGTTWVLTKESLEREYGKLEE